MRVFRANWLKASVAAHLKKQCLKGTYSGTDTPFNRALIDACKVLYRDDEMTHSLAFTRDAGMHSCGWWKNPDYERCFHLSLSYQNFEGEACEHDHKRAKIWLKLLFGDARRLLWVEPPYSEYGKALDVYHYRLFCDEAWQPILPRDEVYTLKHTPKEWLSYSDLQNEKLMALERESVLD